MFEFSRFWPDYAHGGDFMNDMDAILDKLPKDFPYAVEMRSKHCLRGEYFGCLARHVVAHVFDSRDAMPPVNEQIALAERRIKAELDRVPVPPEARTEERRGGEGLSRLTTKHRK